MKAIKINVHSFIDVITNSSTEIFISTHDKTITLAKELINGLLKVAKSEKTADDLFELHTEEKLYLINYNEYDGDEEEKYIKTGEKYDEEKFTTEDSDGWSESRLIIKPKDNSNTTIDLVEKIYEMFEINGGVRG
jgi:hypothetical protein